MRGRDVPRLVTLLRIFAAAVCLIAAVLIVIDAGLPPRDGLILRPGQTPIAPELGAIAPPIDGFDLSNHPFSLHSLRGSPVIVNFWATWCAPCVVEMPRLQAAFVQHRARGLRVVGVNVNEPPASVQAWARDFGISYDLLIDSDGRIAYAYRVRSLPLTYFIDSAGVVRQVASGELSAEQIESAVALLLQSPRLSQTKID